MDNLRNLFGQVSAMTSMKTPSMAATSPPSKLGSMGNGCAGSGGGHGSTKDHKTADRDNYYYIMWRS
uniref:Uncharacterized protein n=1 Tax=Anopheles braziliensis TaxID=58242 RepID=A0A2M3ZDC2_9DIPT